MFLNFLVSSSFSYFQQFLVSSCIHDQCFCWLVLIAGLGSVGASLTEGSTSRGSLQAESYRKTGVLVYKSSWLTLSVTSRREILTSRRHFKSPLSRRDMGFSRRDVKIEALCHVAT